MVPFFVAALRSSPCDVPAGVRERVLCGGASLGWVAYLGVVFSTPLM